MILAKGYSEWQQQWDRADTMQTCTPAATEIEVLETFLHTKFRSKVKAVTSDHSNEMQIAYVWLKSSA